MRSVLRTTGLVNRANRVIACAAVLAASTGLGAGVASATAATPTGLPANCIPTATQVVCSYGYTGAEQTFTVPSGVSSLDLTATGASGGTWPDGGSTPGLGGQASDTMSVAAGTTLYVEVGGAGSSPPDGSVGGAGGYNGGARGGPGTSPGVCLICVTAPHGGAGGGGASDVRTQPASAGLVPSDPRLLVAGGGGGGCFGSAGGNAGASGGSGAAGSQGGGGGTSSGAGAAGSGAGGITDGAAGGLGSGGHGGNGTPLGKLGGCGGGGGFYGGGGGGAPVGSGGGGSSYAPGGSTALASGTGNGSVTISYALPATGCVSPVTGTHGKVYAISGLNCVITATISGNIDVTRGASLDVESSTVSGSVLASSPAGIRICGSTTGKIEITGATGPVVIGDPANGCAGNTINGDVAVANSTGPVTISGNRVSGTVITVSDSGTLTVAGNHP